MNLTSKSLEKYLGRPISMMLADVPFKDWVFEKSSENDIKHPRIDYVFSENGVNVICDETGKVRTIILHSSYPRTFETGLADLPFLWTRQRVIESFGPPSKSGEKFNDAILGQFGPWDRFMKSKHSVHVEYQADSDQIRSVSLMRADIVP